MQALFGEHVNIFICICQVKAKVDAEGLTKAQAVALRDEIVKRQIYNSVHACVMLCVVFGVVL